MEDFNFGPITRAFEIGYAASCRGAFADDNPFEEETEEAEDWLDGFEASCEDIRPMGLISDPEGE